ncbi:MAG: thymidine phosphorylase family protein [Sphingobacteriales bacterium]|nr:MAG: thymidine phosphorylase family protein [Sphingobacteriales bacterium]
MPLLTQIPHNAEKTVHQLYYYDLNIDTNQELVVYMGRNCSICRSEGFSALTRLEVSIGNKIIFASLHVTNDGLIPEGAVGLSESAAARLDVHSGDFLTIKFMQPLASMSLVRAKIFGDTLSQDAYRSIMDDIAGERYSNVELSSFVSACAGDRMKVQEIGYLAEAMIKVGRQLSWPSAIIADKHCVGGLPGNRTTMIVVPIIATLGIPIPKVSSRAITSPAGTADTMEVLAPVNLDFNDLRRVVENENGCIAWGGSVQLSPADDIIIRIERALDIDSEAQLVASILSKKVAAGSTHCLIDIPVGPTAKVRSQREAERMQQLMVEVGRMVGLNVTVVITDGSQPVGEGIGPSLEARDVLRVLRNDPLASVPLREKSLQLAASLLQMVHGDDWNSAYLKAKEILETGAALKKFMGICEAQGGFREPGTARYTETVFAAESGRLADIHNRRISRLAKLAGAPGAKEAGVDLHVRLSDSIINGQPLCTIHANAPGELEYARTYLHQNPVFTLQQT